jgi:hypothetical protein
VARLREAPETFQAEYARRAGIEATISRGVRGTRLRRTRYRGLARVHLGHILTAVGLNVRRLSAWFLEHSRANTRITPFARLTRRLAPLGYRVHLEPVAVPTVSEIFKAAGKSPQYGKSLSTHDQERSPRSAVIRHCGRAFA